MQLKSLFFLVSTATIAVSASTLPDVLNEISKLTTQFTKMANLAAVHVPAGAGTQQAMVLHAMAGDVLNSMDLTATEITDLEKPVPENACDAVYSAFSTMEAPAYTFVQAVVAQKGILTDHGLGQGGAVIGADLINFKKGAIDIRDAVISVTTADCDDKANALALKFINTYDDGIKAYSDA